jgi:hypothetical protein
MAGARSATAADPASPHFGSREDGIGAKDRSDLRANDVSRVPYDVDEQGARENAANPVYVLHVQGGLVTPAWLAGSLRGVAKGKRGRVRKAAAGPEVVWFEPGFETSHPKHFEDTTTELLGFEAARGIAVSLMEPGNEVGLGVQVES